MTDTNQPREVVAEDFAAANSGSFTGDEWHARVELAAMYRLSAHYGYDDTVWNPSTDQTGSSWWKGVRNWVPGARANMASKKKFTRDDCIRRPAISARGDSKTKSAYSGRVRQT